jgi:hypothetical protein
MVVMQVMMTVGVIGAARITAIDSGFAAAVSMAPEREFLEREEGENASEQQREDFVWRQSRFKRLGQQVQCRRRQQQAGGEADG